MCCSLRTTIVPLPSITQSSCSTVVVAAAPVSEDVASDGWGAEPVASPVGFAGWIAGLKKASPSYSASS